MYFIWDGIWDGIWDIWDFDVSNTKCIFMKPMMHRMSEKGLNIHVHVSILKETMA